MTERPSQPEIPINTGFYYDWLRPYGQRQQSVTASILIKLAFFGTRQHGHRASFE